MDCVSIYTTGQPVVTVLPAKAIVTFGNQWIVRFWLPKVVRGHLAFYLDHFASFRAQYNIGLAPIPPRRHYMNLPEPKRGIMKTICFRLTDTTPNCAAKVFAVTTVKISNQMYRYNTISAYEIPKRYNTPIYFSFLSKVTSPELVSPNDENNAKQKLAQILCCIVFQNSTSF